MSAPRLCPKCDAPVSSQSKTGYCRPCFARMTGADKHSRAKSAASIKRRFLYDPEFAQAMRERARRNANTAAALEYKRTICADRLRDPEVRRMATEAAIAKRRSHVPTHLWVDYRKLMRRGFTRAEALGIVMEQFRRDEPAAAAEWDARHAVVVPIAPRRGSDWEGLVADVAEAFGLTFDDLMGDSRKQPRPDARAVCAMLLVDRGVSLNQTAHRLNYSDHGTVLHFKQTWADRCANRPLVAKVYARFCRKRRAA